MSVGRPPYGKPIADFLLNPPPTPPTQNLFGFLETPPPTQNIWDPSPSTQSLSDFLDPLPSTPSPFDFRSLPSAPPPPLPLARSPAPAAIPPVIKRKVYFAFTYDDILRVNNVRQIGKIGPRESPNARRTFSDRSLWERRRLKNDEVLKNLMRNGVKYSSAVCVLIGKDTWQSRWVKYEISRAIVDGRGLFGVHINSLNHSVRRAPDSRGYNPLDLMGIYKDQNGRFFIWEKCIVIKNVETGEPGWEWQPYEDYTAAVARPRYMTDFALQDIMSLSWVTSQYDFIVDGGAKNLGSWIDAAAISAGKF